MKSKKINYLNILKIIEDTFYKFLQKTCKIDLPCFMNSYKGIIIMDLVQVISRVFSKLLKESKKKEEIYKNINYILFVQKLFYF